VLQGLGFRLQGFRFRLQGLGFGVNFGVTNVRFTAKGLFGRVHGFVKLGLGKIEVLGV
jgi:hypothetical protein